MACNPHEHWAEASEVYSEVLRPYLTMLNPHDYWDECQLVRLGAEAMPLHVVTMNSELCSPEHRMERKKEKVKVKAKHKK